MTNTNSKKNSKSATTTVAKKKTTASKNALLGVIAQLAPLHQGKPPRDLVARRAGYGNGSNPSFKKALNRAKNKAYVDLSNNTVVTLTELGQQEAGDPPDIATNEQAQETIMKELSSKMQDAFKLLQDGKVHHRADLAKTMGYDTEKNQGFRKLLDRIRLKGYLDNVGKESVRLSDLCYPNGRDDDGDENDDAWHGVDQQRENENL